MGISAYVPFYNNASTVLDAVESLRQQQPALDEIFAIDDGSTDRGADLLEAVGVRVIRQPGNLGRGAARRLAMQSAQHEFVLCCDATNKLPPDFAARALRWFENYNVAAVVGLITDANPQGVVSRWRARNLFKVGVQRSSSMSASFVTYGAMVRSSAIACVGGYDASLRHTEDAELGCRLAASNLHVVFDPLLKVYCNNQNSMTEVLERYWRWHAGKDESFGLMLYLKLIKYSAFRMAWQDLKFGDPLSCGISLLLPHYQLWRFVKARLMHVFRPNS